MDDRANDPAELAKLAKLAKNFEIKSRDSSKELEARLEREAVEAAHQRYRDRVILWSVVVTVGVVSAVCVGVVVVPGAPPENVKWATTLLTTIVAGGLGYMTGKGSK